MKVMLRFTVPLVFSYKTNSKTKLLRVSRLLIAITEQALLSMWPNVAILVTWPAREAGPHSNRELWMTL